MGMFGVRVTSRQDLLFELIGGVFRGGAYEDSWPHWS